MVALLTSLILFIGSSLLLRPGVRGGAGLYDLPAGRRRLAAGHAARARPATRIRQMVGHILPGTSRRDAPDPWLMPLLVHQLAALLEAGRSSQIIWAEAARSHVQRENRESAPAASARRNDEGPDQLLAVLYAADRAAALGHSVAEVLRHHGAARPSGRAGARMRQRTTCRIWTDLAACWDVAELSGAPLSKLLGRYAVQLEAELDAEAARQSALAGPRATVKLLGWLPFFGLGLGLLMGVDPLAMLVGTPIGLAALGVGTALMAAGRMWSNKMVAAAERPS
ncbi:type II secretion system F family protein [Arthrobacter monumenti]